MSMLKKTFDAPTKERITRATDQVKACINKFALDFSSPVVVGLSGGKDSSFAMLVLRDLGYDVRPVIVDMGYERFKADPIARNAKELGFEPTVLSPTQDPLVQLLPRHAQRQLSENMSFLQDPGDQTPCGACSLSKRMLMAQHARSLGLNNVVLAHHMTDFVTTILKDYFIAGYAARRKPYDRGLFVQFIGEISINLDALSEMVTHKLAAGMGIRVRLAPGVFATRPLALVPERDIAAIVRNLGLATFGSGCSHEAFQTKGPSRATKRELVHTDLVRRLSADPGLEHSLLEIALKSVDDQGCLLFNPRAKRDAMYPWIN